MIDIASNGIMEFWRDLEMKAVLRCPVCGGDLSVSEKHFDCLSCRAVFPVEEGVPLLMRPDEVVSLSNEVIRAFNLPPDFGPQVEKAVSPLVKYRTRSHPEFANFFARFEAREKHPAIIPLTIDEMVVAAREVECITRRFPERLRSDVPEYRSIRLRNNSNRVLFTGRYNPLYLGYKIYTAQGEPVPFEGYRAPLPCPLYPNNELTVAVKIELPAGLQGRHTIRFHLLFGGEQLTEDQALTPASCHSRPETFMPRLFAILGRAPRQHSGPVPVRLSALPVWFDQNSIAEMAVNAVPGAIEFPSARCGAQHEFDIHQDVARSDDFLRNVIADVQSRGITHPRVLEIGAGVYPVAVRVCDSHTTVLVSDISLVMQTLALLMHARHPEILQGRVAFTSFDMTHPPFHDGSFDVICMCAAFHHISAPDDFLEKVASLLSINGRFVALREPIIVDPSDPMYLSELENGFNEQMFELSEWYDLIVRNGFAIDKAQIDYESSLKFSAKLDGTRSQGGANT